MELIWIPAILMIALLAWLILTYNTLVRSRMRVDESWSDIEVQMKRRYDLIPNFVEAVKGYASHESETLTNVIQARAAAMGAQTVQDHATAENFLTDTLKSLFSVTEDYPALQAQDSFMNLQHELSDAEDKIMAARRFYNSGVRDFNIRVTVFPNNLIASMLGFVTYDFFDAPDEVEQVPSVKF